MSVYIAITVILLCGIGIGILVYCFLKNLDTINYIQDMKEFEKQAEHYKSKAKIYNRFNRK